jgi:hypothetical protein
LVVEVVRRGDDPMSRRGNRGGKRISYSPFEPLRQSPNVGTLRSHSLAQVGCDGQHWCAPAGVPRSPWVGPMILGGLSAIRRLSRNKTGAPQAWPPRTVSKWGFTMAIALSRIRLVSTYLLFRQESKRKQIIAEWAVIQECLQSDLTSLLAATNRTKSAAILRKDCFASLWTSRPGWRSGSSPSILPDRSPDLAIEESGLK